MEIIIYQDGEFLKDNKESMDKSCICLRFGYNIHCASLLRKRIKIIMIMISWNIVNLFTLDYSLQIGYTDRVLHKRIPSCCGMIIRQFAKKHGNNRNPIRSRGECEGVTKCRCGSE